MNSEIAAAITQKTRNLPGQHVTEKPNGQGSVCRTDHCDWCAQERLHGVKLHGGVKAEKALVRLNGEQRVFQEDTLCSRGVGIRLGRCSGPA